MRNQFRLPKLDHVFHPGVQASIFAESELPYKKSNYPDEETTWKGPETMKRDNRRKRRAQLSHLTTPKIRQ